MEVVHSRWAMAIIYVLCSKRLAETLWRGIGISEGA